MDDQLNRFSMVNNKTPQISHLFRPLNLFIIAAMMLALRYSLLFPLLSWISDMVEMPIVSQLSHVQFSILLFSVLFIAAGGYIINDIKDVKVDAINHGKNPVGTLVSINTANKLYQICTVIGLVLGFYLAIDIGNYNYGILQLTAAISLWFYANYFKSRLLLGNIIIAFLVALVPLTTGIYEVTLIQIEYLNTITKFVDFNFNFIAYWFIGYAIFAFVVTLAREILKDIEDIKGDSQIGAQTLPIVWGRKNALILVSVLYISIVSGLAYLNATILSDNITKAFTSLIVLMMLLSTHAAWSHKQSRLSASTWNKIASVLAIIYVVALGVMLASKTIFINA